MEEIINYVINNTLSCFDIPFCITVNIATYLIIKSVTEVNKNIKVSFWHKRVVLILVGILCGYFYYLNGTDLKTIFNSIILAPVAWSWILKPICAKLGIDYTPKES